MKNYYEILEVNPNASEEIIKKVYKIHIKNNHPDLFQGEEKIKAEERVKELNEAYDILIDKNSRKDYDYSLQDSDKESVLLEENEYLKNVIKNKDQIIKELLGQDYINKNYTDVNSSEEYVEDNYSNNSNVQPNTYEKASVSQQYLAELKQACLKFLAIVILIIVGGLILYSSTGFNIFSIIFNVSKKTF